MSSFELVALRLRNAACSPEPAPLCALLPARGYTPTTKQMEHRRTTITPFERRIWVYCSSPFPICATETVSNRPRQVGKKPVRRSGRRRASRPFNADHLSGRSELRSAARPSRVRVLSAVQADRYRACCALCQRLEPLTLCVHIRLRTALA